MRQKKRERSIRLEQWEWGAIVKAEPAAGCKRRGKEKKAAGQLRDDVVTEGGRRAVNFFLVLGGRKIKIKIKNLKKAPPSKEALSFHQQSAPYSMAAINECEGNGHKHAMV